MSSYQITLALSGGNWTPTTRRGGTPASGGTAVTIPLVENSNSGTADTTSKFIGAAFEAAIRALVNDRAANGNPSNRYDIDLADSSGNFDPTLRRDGTAASGGTTIGSLIPYVENSNTGTGDSSSKSPVLAARASMKAILIDRALGN